MLWSRKLMNIRIKKRLNNSESMWSNVIDIIIYVQDINLFAIPLEQEQFLGWEKNEFEINSIVDNFLYDLYAQCWKELWWKFFMHSIEWRWRWFACMHTHLQIHHCIYSMNGQDCVDTFLKSILVCTVIFFAPIRRRCVPLWIVSVFS